jgi:hypothetical protein
MAVANNLDLAFGLRDNLWTTGAEHVKFDMEIYTCLQILY